VNNTSPCFFDFQIEPKQVKVRKQKHATPRSHKFVSLPVEQQQPLIDSNCSMQRRLSPIQHNNTNHHAIAYQPTPPHLMYSPPPHVLPQATIPPHHPTHFLDQQQTPLVNSTNPQPTSLHCNKNRVTTPKQNVQPAYIHWRLDQQINPEDSFMDMEQVPTMPRKKSSDVKPKRRYSRRVNYGVLAFSLTDMTPVNNVNYQRLASGAANNSNTSNSPKRYSPHSHSSKTTSESDASSNVSSSSMNDSQSGSITSIHSNPNHHHENTPIQHHRISRTAISIKDLLN